MNYSYRTKNRLSYLIIVITIIICNGFYFKYRPNAYEITMNGENIFYVKDKEEFIRDIKNLQKELNNTFENFKLRDRFTYEKVYMDYSNLNSKEDIKDIILNNSKSEFKKKNVENNHKNKAAVKMKIDLLMPSNGKISSYFGNRWGKMHKGIDIANKIGAPIYAAMEGKVAYSSWMEGYGKVIILNHGNGVETLYAHCDRIRVKIGEKVKKGQRIGDVGNTGQSTGPHVHFEVRVNGTPENPINYI